MTVKEKRQHLIFRQLNKKPLSFDNLQEYMKQESEILEEGLTISLDVFKEDCKDILKKYGVEIFYDNDLSAYRLVESFPQMEQIYFKNNLYQQVYNELPERYSPITRLDMLLLTDIEITECDLDDVSFLTHCKNLESLTFFSNYPFPEQKSYKPLSSLPFLPALKRLSLHNTDIKTLDILSNCPNIESLSICECTALDIAPLNNLPKLKKLNFEDLEITGFEMLNEMPGVVNLSLCNVNIQHFPFQKFPGIKLFNCQDVKVDDVVGLFNYKK